MSTSKEFIAHVMELLSPLGDLTVGRMFGGALVKRKDKQLGIIMGDTLYFRIPEKLREKYGRYNSRPFRYYKQTGPVTVRAYWSVPEEIMENEGKLIAWAEEVLRLK